MRLRNIIKIKTNTPAELYKFTEVLNRGGDAIIMPPEAEYNKIELSTRDLIMKNMELIEKLIIGENNGRE